MNQRSQETDYDNTAATQPVKGSRQPVENSQGQRQNQGYNANFDQEQSGQPLSTAQQSDNASGDSSQQTGWRQNKKLPKILNAHPELDDEAQDILYRHRTNRIPPNSGLEKQVVAKHDGVMGHYDFFAKIDPTSATFDPPAHTLMPMPRGGLSTLAEMHLGRRPTVDPEAEREDRQKQLADQQDYDLAFQRYRNILFRMNTDTLRTDDRYTMGQTVRVPSELE